MLRFVIYLDDRPVQRYRSLVLLQSADLESAAGRALDRGRELERSYVGGTELVSWRLETVETIDHLGANLTDGREVYGEPAAATAGESLPTPAMLDAAQSMPGQSGV